MDNKKQHVLTEKIRLIYKNSLVPASFSALAAALLVAALWKTTSHLSLMIWLAVTVLLAIVRLCLITNFKRAKPVGKDILKWEKPFSISLFAVFLTWSIGLLMVIPKDNMAVMFIACVFSIGLAAAAISWYGYIRYVQLTTICIALIPTITMLLTYGSNETLWVGVAAAFMFLSCISTSHSFQKNLNGNLELAYDLEQSIKQAEVVASTDMLTGIKNRRAFFDEAPALMDSCIKKELPTSVVMFDIDHFKSINDQFGHAGGDVALQHVAKLLEGSLRRSDICCRFGGEEFTLLLPNTNIEEAKQTAEKLRALIEQTPVEYSRESIPLTASFGVADEGLDLDEILNHADQAMYKAKRAGRNRISVYTAAGKRKPSQKKFKSNKSAKVRDTL